ncbi:Asp-tRNA(Asn)/Glu-tRNA(Gln) amidotransferase subunit GatB [Candidatus Gracilibacteria bacterium]|nr:Asp-tRNA(Asn)/Glu-tRNA(Gln) amidotransferase subunit GatB [Candidatus Gracilibacteria bacterium]MCF7856510.1 Asp-tRNA(Asn)/Glu-tRNA(Gln) amidotransferase subunit GatB [Candidatus Gracilibacteria bacterium]MCF7896594.1 Asp-tRNA(Asn)/Glu-tRNA(Gln) amidotransferase subunit GatB [Candidatus Gracilibacteria bacterium]
MKLEAIIGLEIHAQIATKTKMFCSCDNNAFGAPPNSRICPVCTGQPGVLPVPNKKALELGVKAALALNCEIPRNSKFDRKNYFYPDLPYGYQISQFDEPISVNGKVEISLNGEKKEIGITRLHLENDAGKLSHVGNFSLCDYNRAGTPLMEIVSEPDLRSAAEAKIYAEEIQKILQFVGSSNADLFKGEMRFDASVSLREVGTDKLNPRAEIKNLNSFRALESAIDFEIGRQKKLWSANKIPDSDSTVGWDEEKGETFLMRAKESAADYHYFPEPDIPALVLEKEFVESLRSELPELPLARRERFVAELGITDDDARNLTESKNLANYFEEVAKISGNAKKSAAWILSELLARLHEAEITIEEQKITAENLGQLVKKISTGEISGKIGKEIFPEMWATGQAVEKIIESKGLKQISDGGEIEKLLDEAITKNPDAIADFQNGKERALGAIVGEVMKLSKGQANPAKVNELLKKKLAE